MIQRNCKESILHSLTQFPVVGLVGARQVGKTTLARDLAAGLPGESVYLDLERPSDLAKLREPELYLEMQASKLVVLDELHRTPDLFPVLRALVDTDRRNGRFLVLGSASPDLMRKSSESLAGRIIYHELPPLTMAETVDDRIAYQTLWSRGGFPSSLLASSDQASFVWRDAFIRTYLERDIPSLGLRVPASALDRFWHMVAYMHGQLWNANKIAAGLGVSSPTVRHYLDILRETFVVRALQPYHANLKKRLVKTPKIYLRDSGLLHALLGIDDLDALMGHPVLGASWEGWVIEQILAMAPSTWRPWFYRSSGGAEIDLVLERPGRKPPLAFEIKYSASPTLSRGFWSGLSDLDGAEGYVVCPTSEQYPLGQAVFALPVKDLPHFLDLKAKE